MKPGDLVQLREDHFFALAWTSAIIENCVIGSRQEMFLLPTNLIALEIPKLDPFLLTTPEDGETYAKLNILPLTLTSKRTLIEYNDVMLIVRSTDNFIQALTSKGQLVRWFKRFYSPHAVNAGKIDKFWAVGVKKIC